MPGTSQDALHHQKEGDRHHLISQVINPRLPSEAKE
jgi:hypothetical protein